MGNRSGRIVLAICAMLLAAPCASAHRINVFASVAGDRIEGECYSSTGDPVRNATVRFQAPDGSLLGRVRTADDGSFTFTPTVRVEHRVIVETGDGHRATCTVKAEDLPTTLSAPGSAPGPTTARSDEKPPPAAPPSAEAQSDLGQLVSKAIAREVRPLERRIDALQQHWRYRDILGGIGYIFGLAGILIYFKARRPSQRKK